MDTLEVIDLSLYAPALYSTVRFLFWTRMIYCNIASLTPHKEHVRLDLNLATLSELIQFLDIEPSIAEKVLEHRYSIGYFKSYEDIKRLEDMTDELLDKFQKKTIIYNPNF